MHLGDCRSQSSTVGLQLQLDLHVINIINTGKEYDSEGVVLISLRCVYLYFNQIKGLL